MRIKTALLLLLILLQLPSCNKRYAHLRKIRVPHTSAKEVSKAAPKKITKTETIETAGVDSTINLIETPRGYLSEEPGISHNPSTSQKQDKIDRPSTESKKQYHPPKPYDPSPAKLNKKALAAFIFALLAIAFLSLFFITPFVALLFAFLLGAIARSYGVKAYDNIKHSKEKGMWMAIVGIVIGSALIVLTTAITLAALITVMFDLYAPGGAVITLLREFIFIPIAFFLLLLYTALFVKKTKRPEPIPPTPQEQKQLKPGRFNNYAILSFILFYIGIVSLILLAVTVIPFFTGIALITLSLSIVFGVVGYYQIKKYSQTGEWFALIPVLTAAMVAAIGFFYITILLILIWLLSRHLKKRKLNKENKVPS